MTRRIMRAFKLNEISGVDAPAQKGAVVSILKRDDGEPYWKRDFSDEQRTRLAGTGAALDDGSYPIETTGDLRNAVQAYGRASDPAKVKAHIISRAKTLGATSSLPDGWLGKSATGESDMTIKKVLGLPETATEAEVTAAVEKAAKAVTDAALAKAASDTEIAKLKADLAKAGMSDKHQAFCDSDDATMPKGGKAAFVAMSPGERDDHMKANPLRGGGGEDAEKRFKAAVAAAVEKALATEEVIKVGELEVRKSAVGEATFAIVKAQQAEITKERDSRELLEFGKMAETLYPALPGETIAKAKALRSIAKQLDEPSRKAIEVMLKSGNDARKLTFKEVGKGGGNGDDMPVDRLDALAKTFAKDNKMTFEKAYAAVLDTEEGRQLYNESRRAAS